MTREDVRFASGAEQCAGWFYPAQGADGRRPCVVLANGFGATRDSGLEPFAERLAAAGYHALAFDYRFVGASEGEPRQMVSIPRQLEDYAAALAYVRARDDVEAERVVAWGSSFAGGHVFEVAARDGRLAAVIAQVPAVDARAGLRHVLRRDGPLAPLRLTGAALRDALSAARGGPPVMVPIVGPPGSVAVVTSPDAEPAMHAIAGPTFRNEVCARVMLTAGSYRPGKRAPDINCPLLVLVADRDQVAPPEAARDAAWNAKGRAEVRNYPIGHFDVYQGEWLERSVRDQLHFLGRHVP